MQAQRGGGAAERRAHRRWLVKRQRLGAVLFGQLVPVGTQQQGRVQIAGRDQPQGTLQVDLARGVVGQVGAAHDVGHALGRVVHHHCHLVGPQAVGTPQHKVAHCLAQVLLLRTQAAVAPEDHRVVTPGVRRSQTDRPANLANPAELAMHAGAAGAGVDRVAKAAWRATGASQCRRDVGAAAGAGVGQASGQQTLQRRLIGRAAA